MVVGWVLVVGSFVLTRSTLGEVGGARRCQNAGLVGPKEATWTPLAGWLTGVPDAARRWQTQPDVGRTPNWLALTKQPGTLGPWGPGPGVPDAARRWQTQAERRTGWP